ncbi:MAG: DUF2807 domain-containing protein [Chlorobi bacterium]|nr:DUF2807 domain-containing protein [Chlorobiota bacterium]
MKPKQVILSAIIIATTILQACNISGITGNKKVVKQNRKVSENFTSVKVGEGINLFLSQGEKTSITVEADENIQDLLKTEIENGTLKIYFTDGVGNATKNVYVTMPEIEEISASSAAEAQTETKIVSEKLTIDVSSGAELKADIKTDRLICESSSGGETELSGTCISAELKASSGGETNAEKLEADTVTAKASSGGEVSVFVIKKIKANASSGGDILYYGNPETKDINTSSGGNVKHKTK